MVPVFKDLEARTTMNKAAMNNLIGKTFVVDNSGSQFTIAAVSKPEGTHNILKAAFRLSLIGDEGTYVVGDAFFFASEGEAGLKRSLGGKSIDDRAVAA
jgi:hypothetical protein